MLNLNVASFIVLIGLVLSHSTLAEAKKIESAFGITLNAKINESMLTSRYTKSRKYPGAMHAEFRPINAHPLLNMYSVWVTQKSKTVVAIRGITEEAVEGDRYKVNRRRFLRLHSRFSDHYDNLHEQLDGIYGHLWSPRTNYSRGEYDVIWTETPYGTSDVMTKEFHDDDAKVKLSRECSGRYAKKRKYQPKKWMRCVLGVTYEINILKKVVAEEAAGAAGL